ncbi:MAG: sulfurtransferase [Gammaproteobacteria bacterium]
MRLIFAKAAAAALWFFAQAALALQVPGPLVDVAWVAGNIDKVRILEFRPDPETFTTAPRYVTDRKTGKRVLSEIGGHLPGSVPVDFSRLRVDRMVDGLKVRFMGPERADFEKLVRSWGIDRGDAIVIVSLGENYSDLNEAARLYWQFKYFGEDNVTILNGGTTAWLAAEKPVSTTLAQPKAGDWTVTEERSAILASSEQTAQASEQKNRQLVDARPIAQHYGLSKSGAVTQAGHIAGSKPFAQELISKNVGPAAYYLDAATYRALFRQLGLSESEPTIAYCNTGHQATGFWFVLSEVLGNKDTRLYDGSLHQWTLEKRPVVGLGG